MSHYRLFQKLMIVQLLKSFPALYGNRNIKTQPQMAVSHICSVTVHMYYTTLKHIHYSFVHPGRYKLNMFP